MRTSEWLLLGYLAYLLMIAVTRPVPGVRRGRLVVCILAIGALAVSLAAAPRVWLTGFARNWLPLLYIFVCYHLSNALFVPPHEGAEALFARFDRWVRRLVDLPRMMAQAPRLVVEFLELSYFGYYAALPIGYLALVVAGHGGQADRYWTLVLLAQFPCFALLPWVRTRPPWALETPGPMDQRPLLVRRLNRFVISHASIHFNTFPSSHTAGTLATCLGVMALSPATGLALFVLSVCVAVATIVGRYHYAGDAIAAVATALAAWAVVFYGGF